jgi:hypothetical protein
MSSSSSDSSGAAPPSRAKAAKRRKHSGSLGGFRGSDIQRTLKNDPLKFSNSREFFRWQFADFQQFVEVDKYLSAHLD